MGGLRIEREIGRGAYGVVYLARDELIRRQVALKVMGRTEADPRRDRALLEARAVGRLQSPNIVALHRLHPLEDDRGWILELEYMSGGSLKDVLDRETRLSPDRALSVAVDMLRGLRAAHDAGIVHGDIKPGNVLFDADGRAALTDFGLARFHTEDSLTESISAGPAGTPSYMAPEVIMGEPARYASDLWSVGVVFYRCLTGRQPFPAETFNQLFLAVQNKEPRPLPAAIPYALSALVMRLLEKVPEDRPQSAADALATIDAADEAAPAAVREERRPERRPRTFLVGRDMESAVLQDALDDLVRGKGTSMLISGESGMGKSALVRAMHPFARRKGARWIEATVTPLDGLLRPLLRAARFALGADPLAKLEELFADEETDLSGTLLRNLLDESEDVNLTSRQQIAWSLERLFTALSLESPLIVAIEDAHRAQPEDMVLLRDLAERLPRQRVLLLVTLRTQSLDTSQSEPSGAAAFHQLAALPALKTVDLAPLSRDAIYQLLERHAEGNRVAPGVAQRIVAIVEGNPLYAEEMIRHLEETGIVFLDGSVVRAADNWDKARLPHRFHELVAARLAGVPPALRNLLDAAAVDGRLFDADSIAAVAGRPTLEVLRDLQRLYRERRLIDPHGEAYRFSSSVVQRVIYEELAPALRRAIHVALAEHLESREEPVAPERVGTHWERGGKPEKAAPYLVDAAIAAAGRQEAHRAIDLFERAGLAPERLAADDAYVHAEALFRFADCCFVRGLNERMEAIYD
ncbi:MAG: protein kinase, partial [Planctomycetota bacterium]|nr:protein kinase [Planctomycetota bacterium]